MIRKCIIKKMPTESVWQREVLTIGKIQFSCKISPNQIYSEISFFRKNNAE